jgi:20S proteasome alpha/beta subunit
MAGDSRVSNDSIAVHQAKPKVYVCGNVVLGCAGSGSFERALCLVDWTQDWCKEIEKHRKALGVDEDGEVLIGRAGRLYYYEAKGCFETEERYAACGSGALVCLGYLAATPGVPARERVRGAVQAAIQHVPSCGGKVSVVSC